MNDDPIKDPTDDVSRPRTADTPAPEKTTPAPQPAGNGFPFGLIFFLALSVLLAVFAVQNTQDVELEFLGWRGEFPLIMIVVGVFATAVILDEVLGAVLRRRKRIRKAEKQELESYRKKK
jgi:uncharacterized integral membrane protein